jgi:hypothetical protein
MKLINLINFFLLTTFVIANDVNKGGINSNLRVNLF